MCAQNFGVIRKRTLYLIYFSMLYAKRSVCVLCLVWVQLPVIMLVHRVESHSLSIHVSQHCTLLRLVQINKVDLQSNTSIKFRVDYLAVRPLSIIKCQVSELVEKFNLHIFKC